MNQLTEPIKITTELSNIFPDIRGQLCSRHSSLFGKLRTTFNKLYDSLEPERYVVVKGCANIFNSGEQASLWMGLQNGLTVMVRKTYPNAKIFINGNHIDQQIILSSDGKENQGLHPQIDAIKKCLEKATEDLSISKLSGGIIYIHANIPQDTFQYRNALLISTYLSFLIINDNLINYTTLQLIENLYKCNVGLNKETLIRNFIYHTERQFCLNVGGNNLGIVLDNRAKMVICKIDVANEDRTHHEQMNRKLTIQRQNIFKQLKHKYNIQSIEGMICSQINLSAIQFQDNTNYQTGIKNQNFLELMVKQMRALCQFSNNKISINELLRFKWELDSKLWKKYSQEVVELVENVKSQLLLDGCTVTNAQFILIATDKLKYTDLLCKLRRKMHKGQMKSKSLFKIQEDIIQNRWGSDMKIGEKMFTSVPSEGVAIFDPKQAIWFDDE